MNLVNINSPSKFIIDGHWFTRSRYAIVLLENPNCTFTQDIERDKKLLWQKLTMDLFAEVRNLGKIIDQVIITSDYVSWRKSVEFIRPPWENESFNESYKSQRVNKEDVNWTAVHNCFSEWAEMMESNFKIPYFKVHGAEADDLMYYLSAVLNGLGFNCILFSKDGDTKQNIRNNENGSFTAVYTKSKKAGVNENHFIATPAVIEVLNTEQKVDVFDFDYSNGSINDVFNNFFNEYQNDVHPPAFLLEKTIIGDKKDNIFPVMYRRTPKTIQKPKLDHLVSAVEKLGKSMGTLTMKDLYDDDFIAKLTDELHTPTMKMKTFPDEYKTHYKNKFKENRALLYLNPKEIPIAIIDAIKARVIEKVNMMKGTTNLLQAGNFHEVLNIFGMQTKSDYTGVVKGGDIDPFANLEILN